MPKSLLSKAVMVDTIMKGQRLYTADSGLYKKVKKALMKLGFDALWFLTKCVKSK